MDKPAKPYPLGKAIAVGLALAVVFFLLSIFFIFMQARSAQTRLAGEVVAVAADSVTIRSARGSDTTAMFVPDPKLHGVTSVAAIVEGQHIMIRGKFTETGVFEADGLRVIRAADRR